MKESGATEACVIRASESNAQDKEAATALKGDAWFGSVCATVAAANKSREAICKVKSNHGLYPNQFIKEALKEALGEIMLCLKENI